MNTEWRMLGPTWTSAGRTPKPHTLFGYLPPLKVGGSHLGCMRSQPLHSSAHLKFIPRTQNVLESTRDTCFKGSTAILHADLFLVGFNLWATGLCGASVSSSTQAVVFDMSAAHTLQQPGGGLRMGTGHWAKRELAAACC